MMLRRLILVCCLGVALSASAESTERAPEEGDSPIAVTGKTTPAPASGLVGRLSATLAKVMHREANPAAAEYDDPVEEMYGRMGTVLRIGLPVLVVVALLRHLLPFFMKRRARKAEEAAKRKMEALLKVANEARVRGKAAS
ncbi:MAG TPA: hypothetical protein VGL24_00985 [Chthoniobacterales bacterium]